MQTLSTTTFVLTSLANEIVRKYPNLTPVYSQYFDFNSVETTERADSSEQGNIRNTSLPLLAWNRSPLRPTMLGSRGNRFSAFADNPGNLQNDIAHYRTAHLELDFNFAIVDKDIATIESFEVDYLSKEGLGRITQLCVDFSIASSDIGVLNYYIEWDQSLRNLITTVDQNSYCSIEGTARVWGYFVSLYGTSPIINNIKASLDNFYKQSIEQISIP